MRAGETLRGLMVMAGCVDVYRTVSLVLLDSSTSPTGLNKVCPSLVRDLSTLSVKFTRRRNSLVKMDPSLSTAGMIHRCIY